MYIIGHLVNGRGHRYQMRTYFGGNVLNRMFPHLFTTKHDISKIAKEGEKLTQESVREKLLDKTNAMRQKNICASTGIPREIISKFMNGKRDLYPESLTVLNEYLDNH